MDAPVTAAITQLLRRLDAGDPAAANELMPLVRRELEVMARAMMVRQSPGHTLQPTALLNEAYLRLVDRDGAEWKSREHFFAVASRAMRAVLVDHARRKRASKRNGGDREDLSDGVALSLPRSIDLIALDAALEELAAVDADGARVVDLLFFGGLSATEVAGVLGVSSRTVERYWRAARGWLFKRLGSSMEHLP